MFKYETLPGGNFRLYIYCDICNKRIPALRDGMAAEDETKSLRIIHKECGPNPGGWLELRDFIEKLIAELEVARSSESLDT